MERWREGEGVRACRDGRPEGVGWLVINGRLGRSLALPVALPAAFPVAFPPSFRG